jgi:hypothetical protein
MAFNPDTLIPTAERGDCGPCHGTGESSPGWDCTACGGTGFAAGGHCDGCGELADDCRCDDEE